MEYNKSNNAQLFSCIFIDVLSNLDYGSFKVSSRLIFPPLTWLGWRENMSAIKRPKVDRRYVVIDSTAIYHDDKSYVVNPAFEEAWEKTSKSIQIVLLIPEVVRGEICYQQTKQALKFYKEISDTTEKISKITEHKYHCRIKEDKIVFQICERFDKWLKSYSAEIIPTPTEEIDWKGTINKSIWRKAPFSDETKKEKGFRDHLILETLISHTKKYPKRHIVFISNDRLLRDTAEVFLKNNDYVTCFEKIDKFETNINLLKEKLTLSFVERITRKARMKFYNLKDKNCLVYSSNLRKKIEKDFKDILDNPKEYHSRSKISLGMYRLKEWQQTTINFTYIDNPEFVELKSNDEYYWKTSAFVVADFVNKLADEIPTSLTQGSVEKNIRITQIEITWKVNIDKRGGFHNMKLEAIKHISTEFRTKTKEDDENYYK